MTAHELKPCPFCGGKPYLANVAMVGCAYVVCTDCRAQGDDASQEGAITAWNRRADLAAVPEQVRHDDQERNYLHLHNAAYDVWRWFETARPDLIGLRAERLLDAVMGPRPYGNIEPQPDPRDEVIARLVEALALAANRLQRCAVDYDTGTHEFIETSEWAQEARAVLAAAKAVQK